MAFVHGKNAEVTVNGTSLTAFSDTADLSIDVDTTETSVFGTTWKTSLPGLVGASFSIAGNYDPTVTTGPAAVLIGCINGGVPVAVVHKPGGTAAGQRTNSFNAIITSYSESSSVGDKVTFSADAIVTGAVTPTQQ